MARVEANLRQKHSVVENSTKSGQIRTRLMKDTVGNESGEPEKMFEGWNPSSMRLLNRLQSAPCSELCKHGAEIYPVTMNKAREGRVGWIRGSWKRHIHRPQNQQVRGYLSGSVRVLPSSRGLDAACFCVRSSDSAQLSSWAVLHGRVVASRVCGEGRSKSPPAAAACLECRLELTAQPGLTRRRWCGPPLRLQPQYAGQCGDQA
jgi:hypothetical protein